MKHRKTATPARSKPANAKGNPRMVSAAKVGGGNVKTGRQYGKGGRLARKHD